MINEYMMLVPFGLTKPNANEKKMYTFFGEGPGNSYGTG